MAEEMNGKKKRTRRVRHKGHVSQILIYLGKQLRFFVNQSDWKVIPMAAVIAALVGMVIRKRFFLTMEGSLMGAFALACVAIWNGCFNSIQSVCRERAIVKREHRSGMHITSYVAAHMIYQLGLCLLQTGVSIYILTLVNVQFPEKGIITPYMFLDVGITMLLITYAADMMSLFISSLAHTTTSAMTIMPFVLIFQLVFSGGIIPLPEWSKPLSNYTISNYGIKALAAQSDYNGRPMTTPWTTLESMKGKELGGTYTVGQVLDFLSSPGMEKYRDTEVLPTLTVGQVAEIFNSADSTFHIRDTKVYQPVTLRQIANFILTSDSMAAIRQYDVLKIFGADSGLTLESILTSLVSDETSNELLDTDIGTTITLGQVLDALQVGEFTEAVKDETISQAVTLGQVVDFMKNNEGFQSLRDRSFTVKTTVGELIDVVGEENVKTMIGREAANAARKPEYDSTQENIVDNWIMLLIFAAFFALLSVIVLEFIDKDKR